MFDDGSELITNDYTNLFYSNLGLRPSCSTCKYATYIRISDFTVGDYWGVENYNPEFFDNAGISLVYLNNTRAKDLISYLNEECNLIETDVQKCQQPNMIAATLIPNYRDIYWADLKKRGFWLSLKRFTAFGQIWFKVRRKIYKYTGRWY